MTAPVYRFASHGVQDTKRLAEAIAGFAAPGSFLALDGDLGAGKTTFSQQLAAALGVTDTVNSPTFTIIKEYQGSTLPLYHMDVYRLSPDEAGELGLEEYFYGDGLTVVEWAQRIEELLPEDRLSLYIEASGPDERSVRLEPRGAAYEAWCRTLKENGLLT